MAEEFPRVDEQLSSRELDVLAYLSRGLTSAQVGTALDISEETVKTHSQNARYKLRAKNTTHACCEAIRRRLIR